MTEFMREDGSKPPSSFAIRRTANIEMLTPVVDTYVGLAKYVQSVSLVTPCAHFGFDGEIPEANDVDPISGRVATSIRIEVWPPGSGAIVSNVSANLSRGIETTIVVTSVDILPPLLLSL